MILRDIAAALSAPVEGDGSIEIARITDPAHASGPADLALAMTRESVPALARNDRSIDFPALTPQALGCRTHHRGHKRAACSSAS